jgi:CTP synthase
MQKLDPYLNVDPGTMNPFQHGEVFVTEDGAETDLDIGHYERFLDRDLTGAANVTTGQVYSAVIAKERRGEYLGRHRAGDPAHHQRDQGADPGDGRPTPPAGPRTWSSPRSAARSATSSRCRSSRRSARCATTWAATTCFFLHVSLVPYLAPSGELKTKPTQHSVAALRNIGIQPDAIVCRADREIPDRLKRKISLYVRRRPGRRWSRAVDAPSHLRHPEGAAREGWTPTSCAAWACRSGTSTGPPGTTCWSGCTTPAHRHRGAGGQVRRPARRLPVGDRGAAGRRVRPPTPG